MKTLKSGDLITEAAGGVNLVEGMQTWELAGARKDDLECMLACCSAELKTMQLAGFVAAPFYFERVAILYRRAKRYEAEIAICDEYTDAVEAFYRDRGTMSHADVRRGPRFLAIRKRRETALRLLANPKNS